MVSFVNIIWPKQDLIVKKMETFGKRDALFGEIFTEYIRQKHKPKLFTRILLCSQQTLKVLLNLDHKSLVEEILFGLALEACESALATF